MSFPKVWCGASGLDRSFIQLAGARCVTRLLQRQSIVVQPFGVVRAAFHVNLQLRQRIIVLTRGDVQRSEFAEDLARLVLRVLIEHRPKLLQRVWKTSLLE